MRKTVRALIILVLFLGICQISWATTSCPRDPKNCIDDDYLCGPGRGCPTPVTSTYPPDCANCICTVETCTYTQTYINGQGWRPCCNGTVTIKTYPDPKCGITSRCPNRTLDSREQCDPGNPLTAQCGNNPLGSPQTCTANCQCVPATGVCGDGMVDPAWEQCDPRNLTVACRPLYMCSPASCRCVPTGFCGDGIPGNSLGEICDDGNLINGDGCDQFCQPEMAICGDHTVQPGQVCDFSASPNGCLPDQACNFECTACISTPPLLPQPPLIPTEEVTGVIPRYVTADCGNGTVDSGEQCDDGNAINCDECNSNCQKPIFDNTPTAAGTCVTKCTTGGAPATTTDTCNKPRDPVTTGSSASAANYDLVSGKCLPKCTSAECGTGNCPSNLEA